MWGIMFPILCIWFGLASYVFIGKLSYGPIVNLMHKKWGWDVSSSEVLGGMVAIMWPLGVPFWLTIALPIRAAQKFPDTVAGVVTKWKNRHAVVVQETELLAALGLDEQPVRYLTQQQVVDTLIKDGRIPYDQFTDFLEELRHAR